MAVIGTFGSFTAARLGIYASQASLNVTGNNIANINTKGYTRQRMDLVSLYSGGADRYANKFSMNVGYGVLCSSVSQLRDPYLDIRFRNEQAMLGAQQTKLSGLEDLSAVFDEVGKGDYEFGVFENQFCDLLSQLQNLSHNVGSEEYDTLVRSSASTLTRLFNTAALELDTQYDNTVEKLKSSVNDVNTILTQIQGLNEEIRNAGLHGDNALELRDTRNVLIDDLSSYMKVDVTYTTEQVDAYTEVEKIVINLADTSPAINLVDGIYVTQLEMPEEIYQPNPAYNPKNTAGMKYLDWSGKPTDNVREAAPIWNDNNEIYMGKDGKPTSKAENAAPRPNPADLYDFVMEDGTPTDKPEKAARKLNPTYSFMYLKDNGEGTNKASEAADDNGKPKENPNRLMKWMGTDGQPTVNKEAAAPRENPHKGDFPYLTPDGTPTADDRLAAPAMNLEGKSKLTHPYMIKQADGTLEPTDDITKATLQENKGYNKDLEAGMKYLKADGTRTDNKDEAAKVPNCQEGQKDVNMYRIQLKPLTDSKGRYRKDEHDRNINETVDIDDTTMVGSLQALRELLTEEGEFSSPTDLEFDGKAATKRGIPYYEKTLDHLAAKLAEVFNEANQMPAETIYKMKDVGGVKYFVDSKGAVVKDAHGKDMNADNADMAILKESGVLKDEYAYYDGGILFSNNGASDDTAGINAKNISVSKSWGEASVRLLNTTDPDINGTHTTANNNIDHFIALMEKKRTFLNTEGQDDACTGKYFEGTFQEAFRNISTTLGDDRRTTNILYNSYDSAVLDLDNQRSSVSGVDLNDEATNMMQFQKSYSAACRLLTTIDSMLDKLINGTAI